MTCKNAPWRQACQALLVILKAPGSTRDQVVSQQIDRLAKSRNPVRSAWFSEMLCHFFPSGEDGYLLGETMTSLEHRLDPKNFVRVHRGRIVNTKRIVAVHPLLSGTYEMELLGGIRITTGRQYKEIVQNLIHG